jgi:FtsP/CotA-like multicopper oxidase with cupredoxin domain
VRILVRSPAWRAGVRSLAASSALFGLACSAPNDAAPQPQNGDLSLAELPDEDPRSDVVAVAVTAAPAKLEILRGHTTLLAAYSGHVPGPLVRAKRGDRLKVHFENRLADATTLHFHGIRLPNAMDGVPDVTQPPVPEGGSFDYEFELPDAGLYWYHPHCDTVVQMGSGLYGAILVEDPDEPEDIGDETVLVLSDIDLDADGRNLPPSDDPLAAAIGSEGNVVLVNGRVGPTLEVTEGRRTRLRVLNAARARYFRLAIPGRSFLKIGSDGGAIEEPVSVDEPVLAPGERVDLVIEPLGGAGTTTELVSLPITRGLPMDPTPATSLLTLQVVRSRLPPSPALPELARPLAAIETAPADEVPIALTMTEIPNAWEMGINGVSGLHATPIHARTGATQVLVVSNQSSFSHPFHLHGFFFQRLDDAGNVVRPIELKDTIDVPPVGIVKLAVHYDDRPGMWMFHCHILDHAEAGMMGMLHVEP